MSEKLKNDIREYIKYDNYIREYENKIKKIKKIRDERSKSIIHYFSSNNINNKDIKAGDSIIKINEKNTSQGLSQKFLKQCLENYFIEKYRNMNNNKCIEMSNDIIKFINSSRKTSKKITLKRIIN